MAPDLRYRMSRILPVRMTSRYFAVTGRDRIPQRSTWWQWRGRIFRHHITAGHGRGTNR